MRIFIFLLIGFLPSVCFALKANVSAQIVTGVSVYSEGDEMIIDSLNEDYSLIKQGNLMIIEYK